jgi:hypothetical protein
MFRFEQGLLLDPKMKNEKLPAYGIKSGSTIDVREGWVAELKSQHREPQMRLIEVGMDEPANEVQAKILNRLRMNGKAVEITLIRNGVPEPIDHIDTLTITEADYFKACEIIHLKYTLNHLEEPRLWWDDCFDPPCEKEFRMDLRISDLYRELKQDLRINSISKLFIENVELRRGTFLWDYGEIVQDFAVVRYELI